MVYTVSCSAEPEYNNSFWVHGFMAVASCMYMYMCMCVHVYELQLCLVVFFQSDKFEDTAHNFNQQLIGKVTNAICFMTCTVT